MRYTVRLGDGTVVYEGDSCPEAQRLYSVYKTQIELRGRGNTPVSGQTSKFTTVILDDRGTGGDIIGQCDCCSATGRILVRGWYGELETYACEECWQ